MSYGNGTVQSISHKQKLKTKSSTEAELVGADDVTIMILDQVLYGRARLRDQSEYSLSRQQEYYVVAQQWKAQFKQAYQSF